MKARRCPCAIVGIAIATLILISGGINSAATSIDSGLGSANTGVAGLITGGAATAGGGSNSSSGYVIGDQAAYDSAFNPMSSVAGASLPVAQMRYRNYYNMYKNHPTPTNLDRLAGAEAAILGSGGALPTNYPYVSAAAIQAGTAP